MAKEFSPSAKIIAQPYRKKKDGSIPLYLRVLYRQLKKEYCLKIYVSKKEFNFGNNRYRKSPASNIKLNAIEAKAVKILNELDYFSFQAFEEKFFGENIQDYSVASYLDQIKQENYNNGKRGNGDIYKDTRAAIIRFKGKKLIFSDLTPKFLEKFEIFLRKTCGTTTISMYMRTLRSAYNSAIDDKIVSIDLYPFSNKNGKGMGKKGYQIKSKKAQSKFALSKEEMISMIDYPTESKSRLRDSLNYWTFSYLCRGMNFKDMCYLKWENIVNDRIKYIRLKTEDTNSEEKEISIKITSKIALILEQYTSNDPYIFPVLEPGLSDKTMKYRMHGRLKKINTDIREIAKELEIQRSDEIVFYVARHTYASILNEAGINLSDLSESLGHANIKTTEGYIHSLIDRLDKNDEYLL